MQRINAISRGLLIGQRMLMNQVKRVPNAYFTGVYQVRGHVASYKVQ